MHRNNPSHTRPMVVSGKICVCVRRHFSLSESVWMFLGVCGPQDHFQCCFLRPFAYFIRGSGAHHVMWAVWPVGPRAPLFILLQCNDNTCCHHAWLLLLGSEITFRAPYLRVTALPTELSPTNLINLEFFILCIIC